MRTAVSVLLIILFIPIFAIAVVSGTIEFRLLRPAFWTNTFEKNNVYDGLTVALQKSIKEQVSKEGGRVSEAKPITDLITDANVKDFVDKNLTNLLNYVNGTDRELFVYIPVGRAPKGFLPKAFENLPENMSLDALLAKLNVTGFNSTQISYIPIAGRVINYVFIASCIFLFLFLVGFYFLTGVGKRFVAASIALILSGIILVLSYFGGTLSLRGMTIDLLSGKTSAEVLLGTVMPPIANELFRYWLVLGLAFALAGLLLVLLAKRPFPGKHPS